MKCPKCQIDNAHTRKLRRKCGAKLSHICPQCGSENLPSDDFCGECGLDLREVKAAPSIDYSRPLSYTPKHLVKKVLAARSTIGGER